MADGESRINHDIRADTVRVIDREGNQIGVMSTEAALEMADDLGLDLVEVAPDRDPPVCRIMDYGKFKYSKRKREAGARKKSSRVELKEIKLRPATGEHDLRTKLAHARRFLEQHNAVRFTVFFRGREVTHPELGKRLLERAASELEDIGRVDQPPRLEGHRMSMNVSPHRS